MAQCSNPVSCQTAKRELCNCECRGQSHGKLRGGLDSPDGEVRRRTEEDLNILRTQQAELKKQKSRERRMKRRVMGLASVPLPVGTSIATE